MQNSWAVTRLYMGEWQLQRDLSWASIVRSGLPLDGPDFWVVRVSGTKRSFASPWRIGGDFRFFSLGMPTHPLRPVLLKWSHSSR